MLRRLLFLLPALVAACESGDRQLIRDLPATATFLTPALQREVHVVRTEADVPHVYAATRHDAAYVLGFTTARDRFFMMDLARRLGTGRISELLGDAGLASDLQSRLSGMTYLADQIDAHLPPILADHLEAFAAGVNDYLTRCQAGELPPPSEFEIAYPFLGAASPTDLMKPFTRRDLAAIVAVTVYNSSFEPGDIRRAAIAAKLPGYFAGVADEALRREGLVRDVWAPVVPLFPVASAPGLGTSRGQASGPAQPRLRAPRAAPPRERTPIELLDRLQGALERMQKRMNRDRVAGYGSNAWAVARYATRSGNAVMAGDGHLSLAVPSILYQFGLDTTVFGDGELHQLGLSIPGFPIMPIGTNGHVAWSQTQLGEDITDWYREELRLDTAGVPIATRFGDEWRPVVRIEESFSVAAIPALGSKGRQESWARFQTFDGRWLADYEGRVVKAGEPVAGGETVQYSLSGYIVPRDQDGDGVVTAISFNYAATTPA
jgi:penicillin G amidase